MSGTDIRYAATSSHALPTRCPVLSYAMLLRHHKACPSGAVCDGGGTFPYPRSSSLVYLPTLCLRDVRY
eukprot:3941944-Rhodomonas_salina.6